MPQVRSRTQIKGGKVRYIQMIHHLQYFDYKVIISVSMHKKAKNVSEMAYIRHDFKENGA